MQPSLALLTMLSGVSLIATLALTKFRLHPSSFFLPARRPRLMKSGTCSNNARARTCSRSREALPHAAPSMQYSAPRLRPDSRLGMPKRLAKPVYLQSLSSLTALVVSRYLPPKNQSSGDLRYLFPKAFFSRPSSRKGVTEDDIGWMGPFLQVGGVPGRRL